MSLLYRTLVFLGICLAHLPLQGQVAVIANPSVPIDTVSGSKLLDFYAGEIRLWDNNQPIVVYDLKPRGEVKEVFYKGIGKSPARMKSIWMRRKLSGDGEPPEALPDELAVLQRVAATPGSIGFLNSALVDDTVKILLTFTMDD